MKDQQYDAQVLDVPPSASANGAFDAESNVNKLEQFVRPCKRATAELAELKRENFTLSQGIERLFRFLILLGKEGWAVILLMVSGIDRQTSEERAREALSEYNQSGKRKRLSCKDWGCTAVDIAECHGQLFYDCTEKLCNSPSMRLCNPSGRKPIVCSDMDWGILSNKEGKVYGINGDVFAQSFLKLCHFAWQTNDRVYGYNGTVWNRIPISILKRIVYAWFQYILPKEWSQSKENAYMGSMMRVMPKWNEKNSTAVSIGKNSVEWINCQNTMLNVMSLEEKEHAPKYWSCVQLNTEYDCEAQCPHWISFLNSVFMEDTERIALVQEMFGYALVDNTAVAQKLFLLVGDGSNGKSVLSEVLIDIAGQNNVSNLTLGGLQGQFGAATLLDKLINLSTENEFGGKKMDTEKLKSISSGDPIMLERKGENAFSSKLYATLIFCMNKLPYAGDRSYALKRRLIIIPFERRFVECPNPECPEEAKKDPYLLQALLSEKPGILNWAIEGWQRLHSNNFKFSESAKSTEALDMYLRDADPCLEFSHVALQAKSSERIEINKLYEAYRHWCMDENIRCGSKRRTLNQIRQALTNRSIAFKNQRSDGKTYIQDIEFTEEGRQLSQRRF